MRKYSKIIVVAGALVALAAPSAAMANASSKAPGSQGATAGPTETGWVGTVQGNGTTTQQYSASYTDPVFGGPLTCSGVHQVKKGGAVQDSFTCSLNAGGAWASTPYVGETVGWNSDYYGVAGKPIGPTGTLTINSLGHDVTGNVTSYTGVATYPAS
jgi:hypothetical protein